MASAFFDVPIQHKRSDIKLIGNFFKRHLDFPPLCLARTLQQLVVLKLTLTLNILLVYYDNMIDPL